MQKLSDKRIKIIHRSGREVPTPAASKRGFTFFGFFTSSKSETHEKNATAVLEKPVLRSSHLNAPRTDLTAIKSWVALEEKIVHDYKEQKKAQVKDTVSLLKTPANQPRHPDIPQTDLTAIKSWVALEEKIVHDYKEQKTTSSKSPVPLPKTPVKQLPFAFETFSTRTASSSPRALQSADPLRGSKKTFPEIGKFLLAWLVAGGLVFLYVQGTQGASERLVQLQSEKEQLKRSYTELKKASENQSAEMKWLDNQLRDMDLELKTAKADKIAYEQNLEKKYRGELMRITVRYESELTALRGTLRTQNAIVNALKAQSRAFEKIVDQAGMSALSGAAAGFSQKPFSTGKSFMPQGTITSVNDQQGFIVLNIGSENGARSGRRITISRSGVGLAAGHIDRVYPTMSVAVLYNTGMLQVIQEGDSVSFS